MSAVGFNPSLGSVNPAKNPASASEASRDAKVAPPFVRSGSPSLDAAKARSLDDFTQVNGLIPRLGAVREGFQGSIDTLKRAIAKGDHRGAEALLDRIGGYKLDQLFTADGIHPNILVDLKSAIRSGGNPAAVLKNVDQALENNGFKPSGPRDW